ncbi:hypothetical protein EKPV-NSW-ORF180 [Eastern grey kangaroopox virus]|uniref:Uncharacterized protein n=1 Tax=Eastern grey kangaroopox virus TaxID=2042482 RepID=A0A2H4QTS9_9POXV|nr:hypothetical protein EKPV-NSW-ORF180 [Eastern grey kangaroopox virus]
MSNPYKNNQLSSLHLDVQGSTGYQEDASSLLSRKSVRERTVGRPYRQMIGTAPPSPSVPPPPSIRTAVPTKDRYRTAIALRTTTVLRNKYAQVPCYSALGNAALLVLHSQERV